jgi:hypothetical protein
MFDFEIPSEQYSPVRLVSSSDEGFADLNVMDLVVPSSEYIVSNISPLKDMTAKKQLNIGVYICGG